MWAPLGHKHYVLKKEKLENGFTVYVSDFVNLWVRTLPNEEIVAVSKELNPLIEAPESKLIEKVLSLFDGSPITNKTLQEKGKHVALLLESDLSGIKFQFKLDLELQNAESVFKEITLPFMLLAARLQIREKKLIEIILKKDAELNEYRRENEHIKRSHLITREFNKSELMEGELEESNSSFASIMNNPSTILNIVDAALFESTKSHNIGPQNTSHNVGENISSINTNNARAKLRSNMRTRRVKSKIDLQINTGDKKKRENHRIHLKL